MQDTVLTVCALIVVALQVAKPLMLFVALLRGSSPTKLPGFGPYRDTPDGELIAARAEIRDLRTRLSTVEKTSEQKDRLIESLWFRCHGLKFPRLRPKHMPAIKRTHVAGLVSIAAAGGMFLGTLTASPTHTAYEHDLSPTRPTMQATWGAEVVLPEMEIWSQAWRCHNRQPTLLAIGSTVTTIHCHIPLPELRHEGYLPDGDRWWILWYFPERTGPATLVYIRN